MCVLQASGTRLKSLFLYEIKANKGHSWSLSPFRIFNALLECLSKGFRFPIWEEKEEEAKPTDLINSIDDLITKSKEESERKAKREREKRRYTHKLVDPCEAEKDYRRKNMNERL